MMASIFATMGFSQDTHAEKVAVDQPDKGETSDPEMGKEWQRFLFSAKFTHVIGGFSLFVPPRAGVSELEMDLAKFPLAAIPFHSADEKGVIPMEPELRIVRVEQNSFTTTLFLSSESKRGKTLLQITANHPLKAGEPVYAYFYQEMEGRINGMAVAQGVLKERPAEAR